MSEGVHKCCVYKGRERGSHFELLFFSLLHRLHLHGRQLHKGLKVDIRTLNYFLL